MIALLFLLLNTTILLVGSNTNLEKTKENAKTMHAIIQKNTFDQSQSSSSSQKNSPDSVEELVWFRFSGEPLKEVLYYLANKKKLNILLPEGKDTLNQKLTFQLQEKITLSKAWDLLLLFLRITGYTITEQKDFSLLLQTSPATSKDANRQSFPLYAQTSVEDLPQDDTKIIYIYSFMNLQIGSPSNSSFLGSSNSGGTASILQTLLSSDATVITDPLSNSVIIVDYARSIASAIGILATLDSQGFTDSVIMVPLKYTTATTIATLLQSLINRSTSNSNIPPLATANNTSSAQYFSSTTRITPEARTNSLILMGKEDALEKIKNFIEKYIDIPLGTGESILHIYDLQYLNAVNFQSTLQSIVNNSNGSSGSLGSQSTGSSAGTIINGEQYFKGVIIQAETNTGSSSQNYNNFFNNNSSGASLAQPSQAANRLLIAAQHEDWIRIKTLIEELDKPQLQVAIEVLIVDLNLSRNKSLGSQIRNKSGLNIKDTNFQTNHLGGLQLQGSNSNPTAADALMGNLLQLTNGTNLANGAQGGSLILSFKDGTSGMWMISQILNNYSDVKILSQPFIVALNNQQSSFSLTENRLLQTASVPSGGGAAIAQQTANSATLSVNVQPLISNHGKINLALNITVGEYGPDNSILNRSITTNANLNNGEVLVLGGLVKTKISDQIIKTPFFGDIPLLGWAFKNKQKTITKDNLLIFMSPKIINTRPNEFDDPFTRDKMYSMAHILAKGENFEALKDPITQWFFGVNDSEIATQRIKSFESKNMFAPSHIYKEEKFNKKTVVSHDTTKQSLPKSAIFQQKNNVPVPSQPSKSVNKKESSKKNHDKKTPKVLAHTSHHKALQNISINEKSKNDDLKELFQSLKNPLA